MVGQTHKAGLFSILLKRRIDGILFLRNDPLTKEFLDDWIGRYPGHERWLEQGAFNDMVAEEKYRDAFCKMEDKWNATFRVNEVEKPCILAWHGVMPEAKRYAMMRQTFIEDHLRFRV